jgi:hypothetical protein
MAAVASENKHALELNSKFIQCSMCKITTFFTSYGWTYANIFVLVKWLTVNNWQIHKLVYTRVPTFLTNISRTLQRYTENIILCEILCYKIIWKSNLKKMRKQSLQTEKYSFSAPLEKVRKILTPLLKMSDFPNKCILETFNNLVNI